MTTPPPTSITLSIWFQKRCLLVHHSGPGRKSRKQLEGCLYIFKLKCVQIITQLAPREPLHADQVFLRNPEGLWLHTRNTLFPPQSRGSQRLDPQCLSSLLLSDTLFLWLPLPSLPQSQDVFELTPESLAVSCSPVICLL